VRCEASLKRHIVAAVGFLVRFFPALFFFGAFSCFHFMYRPAFGEGMFTEKERAGRAGWENFDVAFELCDDTVSFGGRHDDLFVQGA
jgi:hypothetical protein